VETIRLADWPSCWDHEDDKNMNITEVKICGLTTYDDTVAALDSGADYVGFVLYDRSPRGIAVSDMQAILGRLQGDFKAVGVFVNMEAEQVDFVAKESGLYAAQIHGDEKGLEFQDSQTLLWRAVKLTEDGCSPSPAEWSAERYVVDTPTADVYGGTGVLSNWDRAKAFTEEHRTMLAGGLTPSNVADAVRHVEPIGVDVASGVESQPGQKDHGKVRDFVRNAKQGGSDYESRT
jgi:phosphoribosylanthranilate isomerase